jgi:tetratricopeptide (TPR) repeat protein
VHPPSLDTIESLDILATIYHAVGRRRKAQDLLVEGEAMASSLLGPGHPMRGRLLVRQASVNGLLGNLELSCQQARESVRILEAVLPLDNYEMTAAYVYLGSSLCDQGHYEEGLKAIQKGLQGHPDQEARCRTNLGLFLARMGRLEESAEEGRQAVELFTAKLGPDHPETAAALGRYASPLQLMGQVETAEKMYGEAERRLYQADPFHVRILDQVRNRAKCLLAMNRAEEAAHILQKHRRIYTRRDESPLYQGHYSLLQAQALARLAPGSKEALHFASEARTRFQSPDVDPSLRHEADVLIHSLQSSL